MLCWIFDVDDTLVEYVDFDPYEWYLFIAKPVAEKYKIPISFEIWRDIIDGKMSRRYSERYGVPPEKFWREVDERNLEYRRVMLAKGRLKLYDDALIVKKLPGMKIAWSASSEECIRFVLSTFSILQYFDFVIGKDYGDYAYLEEVKPSPRFIEIIKEKTGCKRCIVVGDSDRDMLAAKNAGCVAVLISRDGRKSEHADFILKSLKELSNKNFL